MAFDPTDDTQETLAKAPIGTFKATLGYRGAPFAGFARQPGQVTVQGELERALSTMLRREVLTVCAGRTDSGVHARSQVISFDRFEDDPEPHVIQRSLNALCRDEIVIQEVREMPLDFSARFDAVARQYRYLIYNSPVPPLFLSEFTWWVKSPLEVDDMREGAAHLLGEHDFISFCKVGSALGKPTRRFLEEISITTENHLGEECLQIKVVGNAFLHSMVRTIVGTLVEVGARRRTSDYVLEALLARDRRAAGPTAPAQGLILWDVRY